MLGVLLAPGPVSILQSVQGLSAVFHHAVTKQKFMAAATKLQEMQLGILVDVLSKRKVFVKKAPEELREFFLKNTNMDLCTSFEYEKKFRSPLPSTFPARLLEHLVLEARLVPAEYLNNRATLEK